MYPSADSCGAPAPHDAGQPVENFRAVVLLKDLGWSSLPAASSCFHLLMLRPSLAGEISGTQVTDKLLTRLSALIIDLPQNPRVAARPE